MNDKEPNKSLGLCWRGIDEAMEELKELAEEEQKINDRRTQITGHLEAISKKVLEARELIK